MQELNTIFRGVHKTTDVLSFPQISNKWEIRSQKFNKKITKLSSTSHFSLFTSHFLLGDIVINIHQAKRQAKTYGLSFYAEIYRLLIHGTLHLLGYDHEKSRYNARVMMKEEEEIFNAIKKVA